MTNHLYYISRQALTLLYFFIFEATISRTPSRVTESNLITVRDIWQYTYSLRTIKIYGRSSTRAIVSIYRAANKNWKFSSKAEQSFLSWSVLRLLKQLNAWQDHKPDEYRTVLVRTTERVSAFNPGFTHFRTTYGLSQTWFRRRNWWRICWGKFSMFCSACFV